MCKHILSARSHAYLFGVLAKEVIDTFGDKGTQAIIDSVIRYGRQRGQRMAQRTKNHGLEPSALNYAAYGEWTAEPGAMDFSIPTKNPDLQFLIRKCPWYEVWQENDLLEKYGYLYCKYVDVAIAEGYNTSIQFDILSCRALGGEACDMRMRDVNATKKDEIELAAIIEKLGNKARMPWDYHCGHLFKTVWEVVSSRFGYAGLETMNKAFKAFTGVYGQENSNAILALMDIDYNTVPPNSSIKS